MMPGPGPRPPEPEKEYKKESLKKEDSSLVYRGYVRSKGPIISIGVFQQKKFFGKINDGHEIKTCLFDSIFSEVFKEGDWIQFSAIEENGILLLKKKHNILNLTVMKGYTAMVMRPLEEINKLEEKAIRSYDDVSAALVNKTYSSRSEEEKSFKEEQEKLALLLSFIFFVKNNRHHPDSRFKLSNFKSSSIVTRHFGEAGWDLERIHKQCGERLTTIQKQVKDFKNSEEYVYVNMLHVALAWLFDELKDCHIGLYFGWRMFSKKLKDDFVLRGWENDEYNTESRRPVIDKVARKITELQDKETKQKLEKKFSFLQNKGNK